MKKKRLSLIISFLFCFVAFTGCDQKFDVESEGERQTEITTIIESTSPPFSAVPTTEVPTTFRETEPSVTNADRIQLDDIPPYSGKASIEINGNSPFFTPDDYTTSSYEISDKYLYNRCHLIAYELSGENANEKNLITGTRYMNIEGMLPFENKVHDYVESTGNRVLYRSTPIFKGDNLVANGVLLEGLSIEDNGHDISFSVYCYNVQPGIDIDYATGDSSVSENNTSNDSPNNQQSEEKQNTDKSKIASTTYILNTNSKKFHRPNCSSVLDLKEKNKLEFVGSREEVIEMGYSPCGRCKP